MNLAKIRQFRSVMRQFERVANLQQKSCCSGVTLAQCLVLLEVEEHRQLTVGSLAARLRLDDSTLSRTIDGLVRKELLDRRRDERDRRVVWIRLTSEGRAICRAIHRDNDAHCRRVFGKIPPSRREAVLRNFELLVGAFLDCEDESTRQGREEAS